MKKKLLLLVSAVLLLATVFTVMSAAATWTEADFIAAPEKELTLGTDYAYSIAVVGDTQIINKADASSDTEYMQTLYTWLKNHRTEKNIQYVIGVGDITDTYQSSGTYYAAEWENAKAALAILDEAGIPYSLVRGNHDISSGMNGAFGLGSEYYNDLVALSEAKDAEGRPMAGFSGEYTDDTKAQYKIENTYRKLIVGNDKYLIVTLDWAPSAANLTWLDGVIAANGDYKVIVTMHQFLYKEGTFADDADSTLPHENINSATWGEIPTGGTELPRTLWDSVLSKHANVEMILCGHEAIDNILTTQLRGDNGNTVTAMLIDAQALDTYIPAGMVAMLYFSEGGDIINVEYISTIRDYDNDSSTNAYFRAENQFSIALEYDDGWTKTPYGYIPTAEYNKYTFHIIIDDDGDINTDNIYIGGTDTWVSSDKKSGALVDVKSYFNNGGTASKYFKDAYVVMSRDHNGSTDGNYSNIGTIPGDVILDLNGHTFYAGSSPIMAAYAGQKHDYGNAGFGIRNGNVCISSGAAVALASNTAGDGATYNVDFDNVKFYYAEGGTSKNPLAVTYAGISGKVAYVNFNVTDCTIDLTGAPSGTNAFNLSHSNNNHVTLTVSGGEIITASEAVPNLVLAEAGDKVRYSDKSGSYTRLTLPKGATAPIGVYLSENSLELGYEYLSSTDSTVSYILKAKPVSDKGIIEVWLIGGQSNASGYAQDVPDESTYDERYSTGFENVIYYGAADDNVISSFTPVKMGQGAKSNFMGAEIGIASALGSSDGMHAVIKYARGASYLWPETGDAGVSLTHGTWTSPSYISANSIATDGTLIGALYNEFIETVAKGLALLKEQGYTPVIRGMWWMQGEAETSRELLATSYDELLEALINDVRADLSTVSGTDLSEMPFVAGNVYRNEAKNADGTFVYTQPEYLATVNAAQAAVAERMTNVFTVATSHLAQKDGWHFTAAGQKYLGEQFVIKAVRATGKYSVILSGKSAALLGAGAYAAGDTVTVKMTLADGCSLVGATYLEANGTAVDISFNADGTYSFTMPANDVYVSVTAKDTSIIVTPYGSIPKEYADASKYPFLAFKDGVCIGAEANWTNASQIGIMKIANEASQTPSSTVYILMRADYEFSSGKFDNFSQIKGKVVVDLDGHTFKVSNSQGMFKPNKKSAWNSTFEVKNGTVELNKGALLYFGANKAGLGYGFNFTFDNITVSFTEGATYKYVATTMAGSDLGNHVFQNVTFKGCTFDLRNAPAGAVLFNLGVDTALNNLGIFSIEGGKFIYGEAANVALATLNTGYKGDEADKVIFAKDENGNYTTFSANTGSKTPTGPFIFDDGKEYALVKINDNSTGAEFKFVDPSVGHIEFIPKVSILLDRDLVFNIYVPMNAPMVDLMIDGKSLADEPESLTVVTLNGEEHYLISIPLGASVAARDINMTCTFITDEIQLTYANAEFKFNTVKYAQKVLADGTDTEKQLIRDVLSYIRASYTYFGVEDAAKMAAIDAILGENYDSENTPETGVAANDTAGLAGATLVLNGTPAIRFYLATGTDASALEFYIGQRRVETVVGTDTNGAYIEIDVYAYAMCETVTYTVNGEAGGSYNVYSYLEYAKESNTDLYALVVRFVRYCQSAKAYKNQ